MPGIGASFRLRHCALSVASLPLRSASRSRGVRPEPEFAAVSASQDNPFSSEGADANSSHSPETQPKEREPTPAHGVVAASAPAPRASQARAGQHAPTLSTRTGHGHLYVSHIVPVASVMRVSGSPTLK